MGVEVHTQLEHAESYNSGDTPTQTQACSTSGADTVPASFVQEIDFSTPIGVEVHAPAEHADSYCGGETPTQTQMCSTSGADTFPARFCRGCIKQPQ
jgi:hypothetical protein